MSKFYNPTLPKFQKDEQVNYLRKGRQYSGVIRNCETNYWPDGSCYHHYLIDNGTTMKWPWIHEKYISLKGNREELKVHIITHGRVFKIISNGRTLSHGFAHREQAYAAALKFRPDVIVVHNHLGEVDFTVNTND